MKKQHYSYSEMCVAFALKAKCDEFWDKDFRQVNASNLYNSYRGTSAVTSIPLIDSLRGTKMLELMKLLCINVGDNVIE